MHRKVKHTISISLVIVLLMPMTIKLFDGLFHHHDYFHCTAKNEKHYHKYHEKCPILSFELSFFSVEKQIQPTHIIDFGVEQNDIYHFVQCCNSSRYSFLLRAPPIFTRRTMTS